MRRPLTPQNFEAMILKQHGLLLALSEGFQELLERVDFLEKTIDHLEESLYGDGK